MHVLEMPELRGERSTPAGPGAWFCGDPGPISVHHAVREESCVATGSGISRGRFCASASVTEPFCPLAAACINIKRRHMTRRFRSEPLILSALQAVGCFGDDEQASICNALPAVPADTVPAVLDAPQCLGELCMPGMNAAGERDRETTVARRAGSDAKRRAVREERLLLRVARERSLYACQLRADVRLQLAQLCTRYCSGRSHFGPPESGEWQALEPARTSSFPQPSSFPRSTLPRSSRTPSAPSVAAPVARSHLLGPPPCSAGTKPDRRARTLPAVRSAPAADRRVSFQPMQVDHVRSRPAPSALPRADPRGGAAPSADPRRFQCTVSFL